MSKAAHTPTPWFRDKFNSINDKDGFGMFDGQEILVLQNWEETGARHWNEKPGETYREISPEEAAANSDLIVTAVNHHHELITRLYNLVNALDLMGSPDYNTASIFETIELRKTEARETLKKLIP